MTADFFEQLIVNFKRIHHLLNCSNLDIAKRIGKYGGKVCVCGM